MDQGAFTAAKDFAQPVESTLALLSDLRGDKNMAWMPADRPLNGNKPAPISAAREAAGS